MQCHQARRTEALRGIALDDLSAFLADRFSPASSLSVPRTDPSVAQCWCQPSSEANSEKGDIGPRFSQEARMANRVRISSSTRLGSSTVLATRSRMISRYRVRNRCAAFLTAASVNPRASPTRA